MPMNLSEAQKIIVTFRVEPGSLGPTGADHIEAYCAHAQSTFANIDAEFARWNIIPRHDKSLPELEYTLNGKRLNSTQAEKYLTLIGKPITTLEDDLEETISRLIEEFLGR